MKSRGHALLLVMMIMAAAGAAAIVMASRISIDILGRRPAAARLQALWLARSAILSGASGRHDVVTASGRATVRAERQGNRLRAIAELQNGRAEVSAVAGAGGLERWEEKYEQVGGE